MASACSVTDRISPLITASAVALMLLIFVLPAAADGPSATANLWHFTTREMLDGAQTDSDSLNQNYYFSLTLPVNPVISYQLYLRANINDSTVLSPDMTRSRTHLLTMEPTFDFFLKNPMYNVNVGYRRTESRSSYNAVRGSETIDYTYARMNLTLDKYPLFSLLADRKTQTGYQAEQTIDKNTTSYSGTSSYHGNYRDLLFSYDASYIQTGEETPLSAVSRRVEDRVAGSYSIGYAGNFLNNRVTINSIYQGNYSRNSNIQSAIRSSTIITPPFAPLFGGHAPGTAFQPAVDVLAVQAALTDGNLGSAIGSIDLRTRQYHNTGISVPSTSSVDRLYVYVNANLSAGEANLGCGTGCATNWRVYRTTNNVPLTTWTQIPLKRADLITHDALNNIYYYELLFNAPQSDVYFKAVNMVFASPADPTVLSVPVTEIEARGSQAVTAGQDLVNETTVFSQGFSLGTVVRPLPRLSLNLQYSINRTDINPESLTGSISGLFQDLLGKKAGDNKVLVVSTVIRNYSASVTWLTHRLLTTTARVNRSESFDKAGSTDFSVNTYALDFNAKPLPAMDSTLTLSRSQAFNFELLSTTNDSAVITLGSRLYTDVTMITDLGLNRNLAQDTGITTTSEYINGTIYAVLTPRASADLRYGFRWSNSNSISSTMQEGALNVYYRPGRFLSLSANLKAESSSGLLKLTQGLFADWIPVKAFRGGLNYQHTTDDQSALKEGLLGAYTSWKITKFMEARLNYNLQNKEDAAKKQQIYTLGLNLNCTF